MRKFFALALAVAMVLSLASVSFAATDNINEAADITLEGPYRYKSDENLMVTARNRYGEGTYYLIKIKDTDDAIPDAEANGYAISAYKEVEKLKVKAEFEMGQDLVESVSIVKKYVDVKSTAGAASGLGVAGTVTNDGYYYFVEIKVASKETTSEADIIGTLEFNRKADKDVTTTYDREHTTGDKGIGKIKDDEYDFHFAVFYGDNFIDDADPYVVGMYQDEVNLKYDTNYALKFENDEEVEFNFGDANNDGTNEGTFTVDVSGQGKVFLKYNTKANEAISAANPGVKMFFVNFNGAKFNRVGEFVYEMDDVVAAYKVVGDQLVEIKGVEIGTDEVTFNTRVLESYVFADAELVNPAAAVVEAPVVEAPAAVTNPSTGA